MYWRNNGGGTPFRFPGMGGDRKVGSQNNQRDNRRNSKWHCRCEATGKVRGRGELVKLDCPRSFIPSLNKQNKGGISMLKNRELSESMQDLIRTVRENGDKVACYTEECKLWQSEHPNCIGCPSALGCFKTVTLAIAVVKPGEPDDEFIKFVTAVLSAKTTEELDAIKLLSINSRGPY